jgi:PKD repeat protein
MNREKLFLIVFGLVLTVLALPVSSFAQPANDNFAEATIININSLPFSDMVDNSSATTESGEPQPSCGNVQRTVWYAITPTSDEVLRADMAGSYIFDTVLGVYTGADIGSLIALGCAAYSSSVTFLVSAGTTYYIQAGDIYSGGGNIQLTVEAVPLVADFLYSPADPSVYDTIQFFNQSYDPAGLDFESSWDFGDGTTATDSSPTHKYAREGDYTVQLTITTEDGRTASATKVISVKTHDIAITKFVAPTSASAGQTRPISVGINSKRYPETVRVELYKSDPTGYQLFGTLTQSVPVRPANRTTNFNFNYTFTPSDAKVGKVTFKAIASIIGGRDALPADNEAISMPTKVTR